MLSLSLYNSSAIIKAKSVPIFINTYLSVCYVLLKTLRQVFVTLFKDGCQQYVAALPLNIE